MKKRDTFLVFGAPVIEQDEIDAVTQTMQSRWIGTGPRVAEFEQCIRDYVDSPYSVALNSCTAGLHLALKALDLPAGSEVITTAMTFCATANAIIHAGCIPILCDVDPVSRNITPEAIEGKITMLTKAILPVHFAGYPCDMEGIMRVAKKHGLYVVEDCAHAIETTINGKHAGTFGDIGCFSFYVTKNITTGEGGMIVTANKELEAKIKILALHGMSKDAWKRFSDEGYKHYEVVYAGYKYNLTDMQAAMGLVQMKKIDRFFARRTALWDRYMRELRGLACRLPERVTGHAQHLFCIEVESEKMGGKSRDKVLSEFNELNIGTGVHYQALHLYPYYREQFGYKEGNFPHAEKIGASTLSLPFSAALSDSDACDVISAARMILQVQK